MINAAQKTLMPVLPRIGLHTTSNPTPPSQWLASESRRARNLPSRVRVGIGRGSAGAWHPPIPNACATSRPNDVPRAMNDFRTFGEQPAVSSDSRLVWIAGILAVTASFPGLFARGLLGDDWVVHYTYWTEGLSGVTYMMWIGGHGGYSIAMDPFVALGRDMPNVVARIMGLGCHVLNGMLLYRVLRIAPQTRTIAALAAALFFLSPFYAIRLTLNADYD